MSIHLPKRKKPDEYKDFFYDQLESTYDQTAGNGIEIIIGDLKAKIWQGRKIARLQW